MGSVCPVVEGIFIGSQDAAANERGLRDAGVTHVLNVATGVLCFFADVNWLEYRVWELLDTDTQPLDGPQLHQTLDWMHAAVSGGGRVLVHCNAGTDESDNGPTIVIVPLFDSRVLLLFVVCLLFVCCCCCKCHRDFTFCIGGSGVSYASM